MTEMFSHWCDEHPTHPTGPGVKTNRAIEHRARAIAAVPDAALQRIIWLVDAGILSKWEAISLIDASIGQKAP